MDKQDLIKILVVLIAVGFLTEIFTYRGDIPFLHPPAPQKTVRNLTGTTEFSGMIRTYDRFLVIPPGTDEAIVDRLKAYPGVSQVRSEASGYVIQTETGDDVFPIATYLRSEGVSSQARAYVIPPQHVLVSTITGPMNVTFGEAIAVVTEPLLDIDSTIPVNMTIVVDTDGNLVDILSAESVTQEISSVFDGRIISLDHRTLAYTIPWENRTGVGDLSGYGDVDFRKVDSIVFTTPLTTTQVMAKKMFPYILYIDTGSAMVEPSYSNASEVAENFQDANYTLPSSRLTIVQNDSALGEPAIGFDPAVSYYYKVSLENSSLDFGPLPLIVQTASAMEENESVRVEVSATALGGKVTAVRSASIPS